MKKLPLKYSKKWLWILIAYWVVLFGGFIITRILLDTQLTSTILSAFALLAFISALIPCFGGFLGGRLYFMVSALFSVIALLYMLFVILGHSSPGWEDLTSVVSYLFISIVGALSGLISEITSFLVKKYKAQ